MRAVDLIRRKRDSGALSPDEIRFLIDGYTRGNIPDYQMAAWLMAAWIRGLNPRRTGGADRGHAALGRSARFLRDLPGRESG